MTRPTGSRRPRISLTSFSSTTTSRGPGRSGAGGRARGDPQRREEVTPGHDACRHALVGSARGPVPVDREVHWLPALDPAGERLGPHHPGGVTPSSARRRARPGRESRPDHRATLALEGDAEIDQVIASNPLPSSNRQMADIVVSAETNSSTVSATCRASSPSRARRVARDPAGWASTPSARRAAGSGPGAGRWARRSAGPCGDQAPANSTVGPLNPAAESRVGRRPEVVALEQRQPAEGDGRPPTAPAPAKARPPAGCGRAAVPARRRAPGAGPARAAGAASG